MDKEVVEMRRRLCVISSVSIFLSAVGLSSAANAGGDSCATYVGKKVAAVDFNMAVSPFLKIPPKGEYETTAQFKKRLAAALVDTPRTLIIRKDPEDRNFLEYNADVGTLNVQEFAFRNNEMSYWDAFRAAGYKDKNPADSIENVAVSITSKDEPVGTYTGSNAYGTKASIVKINRSVGSIFERKGFLIGEGLFPKVDKSSYVIGKLRLPPPEAKRLKNSLTLAFAVLPKEPYVVRATYRAKEATRDYPYDVTETATILMANITCGLVLDGDTVLAAYPTR